MVLDREDLNKRRWAFFEATSEFGIWGLPKDEIDLWRKFYIRRKHLYSGNHKNEWHLAWNGARFAGSRDAMFLNYKEKLFYKWFLNILSGKESPFQWLSPTQCVVNRTQTSNNITEDEWWDGATEKFVKPKDRLPEALEAVRGFGMGSVAHFSRNEGWVSTIDFWNDLVNGHKACNSEGFLEVFRCLKRGRYIETDGDRFRVLKDLDTVKKECITC